jgi:hypothetical protein
MMQAQLAVQINQATPPRPTGVGVIVGGKVIAVVSLAEWRRITDSIARLEDAAWEAEQAGHTS